MIKKLLNKIPRRVLIYIGYIIHPFLIWSYKGGELVDPIDGNSYKKFISYGYKKLRKNALSPGTLSLERHRLMYLFLKNETFFFKKTLKVLHIAPEQCFIKRFKKLKNLKYFTVDLYSPIADIKANILNLPFSDRTFDVIFCNHVLEHIQDDRKAIQELYRVMKKGGFGVFQVPIKNSLKKTYENFSVYDPKEKKIHFGQYDHVRLYGIDYFDRLRESGFEVFPIKYCEKLGDKLVKKYALNSSEIIPYVKKI